MKNKTTLKIFSLCLFLQTIQSFFPSFLDYQVLSFSYLTSIKSWPLFLFTLLGHMFSHANWPHLCGNFTIGIPCLLLLERRIGSKETLNLYIITGLVAACVQATMPTAGGGLVGASGAIAGCLGAVCVLLGGLWGVALLALFLIPQLQMLSVSLMLGPVAFAAHIAGIVAGMWLIAERYKKSAQSKKINKK